MYVYESLLLLVQAALFADSGLTEPERFLFALMAPKSRDRDYQAIRRAKKRYSKCDSDGKWYKHKQERAGKGRWSAEKKLNPDFCFNSLEEAVAFEMTLTAKRRESWTKHPAWRDRTSPAVPAVKRDLLATIRSTWNKQPGSWRQEGCVKTLDVEAALAAFMLDQDIFTGSDFFISFTDVFEYIQETFGLGTEALETHQDEIAKLLRNVFGRLDGMNLTAREARGRFTSPGRWTRSLARRMRRST